MPSSPPHRPAHTRSPRRASTPGPRPVARRLPLLAVVVLGAAAATAVVWLVPGAPAATPRPAALRTSTTTATAVTSSTGATSVTTAPPSTAPPTAAAPTTVASPPPGPSAARPAPSGGVPVATPPTTTAAPAGGTPPCTAVAVPGGAYAVGDSVMIDAASALQRCVPGIDVNAAVSRQWSTGETVLRQVMANPSHPAVVVVGLGTNGPVTAADFDAMMAIVQGASRVVFVTVHVDQAWQNEVNGVLAAGVARYPTAVLADWQGLAAAHPEWFYGDGTHLPIDGPGAQALAALIASRV